jgi:hypothetical protein
MGKADDDPEILLKWIIWKIGEKSGDGWDDIARFLMYTSDRLAKAIGDELFTGDPEGHREYIETLDTLKRISDEKELDKPLLDML